jgi:hypothetical protein
MKFGGILKNDREENRPSAVHIEVCRGILGPRTILNLVGAERTKRYHGSLGYRPG